jgi:hypothetical protein
LKAQRQRHRLRYRFTVHRYLATVKAALRARLFTSLIFGGFDTLRKKFFFVRVFRNVFGKACSLLRSLWRRISSAFRVYSSVGVLLLIAVMLKYL